MKPVKKAMHRLVADELLVGMCTLRGHPNIHSDHGSARLSSELKAYDNQLILHEGAFRHTIVAAIIGRSLRGEHLDSGSL